jgi:prepilin-type N-terminal cleavage/methylation domain-containing protein
MRNIVQSAKCKVQNKGFTLIELLVVISIIGILATLLISRYGMAEKSARDTQRKSDLSQYRNALENYASQKGGAYPKRTTQGDAAVGEPCTSLSGVGKYLSICLTDPRSEPDGEFYYRYQTDAGGLNYVLGALMETGEETTNYWFICSNGISGAKGSVPSLSDDCGVE